MIGDSAEAWKLLSTGGNPIYLVEMLNGIVPQPDMSPQFVLGGLMNELRTHDGAQAWVKVKEGKGELSYYPAKEDGYEPLTEIRNTIIDLNTEVIHLTTRMTKQELYSDKAEHWRRRANITIPRLQSVVAHVIADLTLDKLANRQYHHAIRMEIEKRLYQFQDMITNNMRQVLNEYTTKVNMTSDDFYTFSTAMIAMLGATSEASIDLAYESILKQLTTHDSSIQLLQTVRDMAKYILNLHQSAVEQEEHLSTVDELLPVAKPMVADTLDMDRLSYILDS
jgi:hypothetical protein